MQHPKYERACYEDAPYLCKTTMCLIFNGSIDSSMESLFRRGDEYLSGYEELILTSPSATTGDGKSASLEQQQVDFFAKLEALSQNAPREALQATHGPLQRMQDGVYTANYAFMARFPTLEQAADFRRTPVYEALQQGDARLPVQAVACITVDVQPVQESNSNAANTSFLK